MAIIYVANGRRRGCVAANLF